MNFFRFIALIAFPFAVLTTPLAASAADGVERDTGAENQAENIVLAGNRKDDDKDGKDHKDDKDKDDKKDGQAGGY